MWGSSDMLGGEVATWVGLEKEPWTSARKRQAKNTARAIDVLGTEVNDLDHHRCTLAAHFHTASNDRALMHRGYSNAFAVAHAATPAMYLCSQPNPMSRATHDFAYSPCSRLHCPAQGRDAMCAWDVMFVFSPPDRSFEACYTITGIQSAS